MTTKTLSNPNIEFNINITTNIKEISENDNKTYILVNNKQDIELAYNSLNYTNIYSGYITVSLIDIYNKFNNIGIWNYKHIKTKDKELVKQKLKNLNTKDLFIVVWCNNNTNLIDINDLLEQLSNTLVSMPIIPSKQDNYYELGIFYK